MKNPLAAYALLASLALPLASTGAGVAYAHEQGRGQHAEKMMQKLNLTPDQKQKITEIRKADAEQMKAARGKVEESKKKLDASMKANASKDEIWKNFNEYEENRRQMVNASFAKSLEIRDVLTPDQRTKFRELWGEKRERLKEQAGQMGDY